MYMKYQQLQSRLLEEKEHLLERLQLVPGTDIHESMRDNLSELSLIDNHPA